MVNFEVENFIKLCIDLRNCRKDKTKGQGLEVNNEPGLVSWNSKSRVWVCFMHSKLMP